jgi:hypothetical protein
MRVLRRWITRGTVGSRECAAPCSAGYYQTSDRLVPPTLIWPEFLHYAAKLLPTPTNLEVNVSLLDSVSYRSRANSVMIIRKCKAWGYHGGNYEECHLLGYKTPVRTSQETYYVYATESNQLMLRKTSGFHGGDYEECRPLGYRSPVRTSQKTHYVSTTESSQLMLCKI